MENKDLILVEYAFGNSIYHNDHRIVDIMMTLKPVVEDDSLDRVESMLYCEVEIEDEDVDEDGNEKEEAYNRHFEELKAMVIEKAKKNGVDVSRLRFIWDEYLTGFRIIEA